MQNLFHDGGFSSVGMSLRAMATYEKGLDEYMDEKDVYKRQGFRLVALSRSAMAPSVFSVFSRSFPRL